MSAWRREGVEGNRRLTAMLGAVLLVLLAIEGGTIPFLSQLEVVHVVVGLVLIPVVLLKLGTTFYRFIRYYTGQPEYRQAGPPPAILRLIGPIVVITTIALFASGIALAIVGHHSNTIYTIHKLSFIAWFGTMTVHVLGHLRSLPRIAIRDWSPIEQTRRSRTRLVLVASVVVGGILLASALYPALPTWGHG